MSDLVLKGIAQVDDMKFYHIEGGFGEGKKSMTAVDIARIHRRELKDINRNINNNIKRFKQNIDILDLKKLGGFKSLALKTGYSNQSYANANNIYVLSERGYAKLLKILEDDFAWEQYEKIVDGYFNMRQALKGDSIDIAKMLNQQVNIVLGEVDNLSGRVEHLENNMTVDFGQQRRLQNKAKSIAVGVLGGIETPAYRDSGIRSKVFSAIWRDYKDYFMLGSYRDTSRIDFDKAMEYLDGWQAQGRLLREIEQCNNQMDMGEVV